MIYFSRNILPAREDPRRDHDGVRWRILPRRGSSLRNVRAFRAKGLGKDSGPPRLRFGGGPPLRSARLAKRDA